MFRRHIPRLTLIASMTVLLAATTACGSSGGSDSSGSSSAPTVLQVGTLTDAKPNVYVENGEFTGFDNDLLRAIAQKEGLTLKFQGTDFSALLSQVANGRFDIGSSAINVTDKRKQTVDFTDGYLVGYVGLLAKQNNPVNGYDTLSGRRVGVVTATIEDDYATRNFTSASVVRFPNYSAVFSALRSGSIDAWFLDQPIGKDYLAKNAADKLKLVGVQAYTDSPQAYAVRKGNTALRSKLDDGLKKVVADGTWLRLYQQYFPGDPVPDQFQPSPVPSQSS